MMKHRPQGPIANPSTGIVQRFPNEAIRTAIGRKILRAMSLRDEAASAEDEARSLVERTIEEGAR